MKELSVSVVICTKNRSQDLKECIESIYSQKLLPDEIIVVDCSDNNETELLINHYKKRGRFDFKYTHTLPGLTRQRNIGVIHSKGDIISFLDDDVILDDYYFEEIITIFEKSNNIDAVGGLPINTVKDSTSVRAFKRIFMLPSYDYAIGKMSKSGFAVFPFTVNRESIDYTQVLIGCAANYKKSVFNESIFDEFFDGYSEMEDIEFSYRLSREKNLLYNPFAKLIHKQSEVSRHNLKKSYEMRVVNHFHVFKKLVYNRNSDWLFFWWSQIGVAITSVKWALKMKTLMPIKGFVEGHRKHLKNS